MHLLERNGQFARYLATFAKKYMPTVRPKASEGGVLSIENLDLILRLIRGELRRYFTSLAVSKIDV